MTDDKDFANISDNKFPGFWLGGICWSVNWIWFYYLLLKLKHKMESYILFLLTVKTSLCTWHMFQWCMQCMLAFSYSFIMNLFFFCFVATPMPKSTNQDSQDYQAVHNCEELQEAPEIPVSFFSRKIQNAAWHVAYASNPNIWKAEAGLPRV